MSDDHRLTGYPMWVTPRKNHLKALPTVVHPTWCDPGACESGISGVDHREVVVDGWKPAEADVLVTVSVSRLDEVCPWAGGQIVGSVEALVALENTACGLILEDGTYRPVGCEVALSAASARHLAGLLSQVADRIDAIAVPLQAPTEKPHRPS